MGWRSAAIESTLRATATGKDRIGGDSGSSEPTSPISWQIGQRSLLFFGKLGTGAVGRRLAVDRQWEIAWPNRRPALRWHAGQIPRRARE